MAASSGSIVAYAADDDVMLPDHLERLGRAFDDPTVMWAYSRALWVSQDGIAGPDLTNLDFVDERSILLQSYNTISGGSMMFRVEAFQGRRCWPEYVLSAADWEMMKLLLHKYGTVGMRRGAEPTYFHFAAGQKTRRDSHFDMLAG